MNANQSTICAVFCWKLTFILTHWGRVTHICVSDLTSNGSDNGLSPGRRQAIIRTNAGILLIRPLGTNFSEILVEIIIFSFKKMRLKVSSAKRRSFCLGLNELRRYMEKRNILKKSFEKTSKQQIYLECVWCCLGVIHVPCNILRYHLV